MLPGPELLQAESQGVLRIAYTAAGFVLLLPYHAFRYMARSNPARPSPDSLLADTALLLLLVLTHYSTGIEVDAPNPFRTALQACRDMDYDVADPEGNPVQGSAIRVPFPKLYDRLGECLVDDRATLLLYALIHGNEAFLEYVLVRSDLDTIVLPLMEMLYNAVQRTPNQIYMILIILLILSQDPSFNANIHKVIVQAVPWYKERLLTKVSLGSLVVILLIRTIKYAQAPVRTRGEAGGAGRCSGSDALLQVQSCQATRCLPSHELLGRAGEHGPPCCGTERLRVPASCQSV